VQVKICGLKESNHVKTAVAAGARFLGFNFFRKSPRFVSIAAARELSLAVPAGICKVALTVDADDEFLGLITKGVPVDMLQLHGSESPQRVAEIRATYGLPVMKAVSISDVSDLSKIDVFARVADQLLIDAKPPENAELPGGNGLPFDWRLIAGRRWTLPWMLAGGLTAGNLAQAVRLTGAPAVDVSSGVENRPGVKDGEKIAAFVSAANVARG